MLTRAYSTLDVRSIDDEQRIIEGIASTPETDRMGDVIEPKGAEFRLPMPLLWQHNAREPIGHVVAVNVTDDGIQIRAQIAKNVLPRIDEAWALIKSGLVRGLSIGFRPTKDPEPIKGTFGLKFAAWEWLELSAVTIPANAGASIHTIKSIDAADRAATGEGQAVVKDRTPGGTGRVVKATPQGVRQSMAKTIQEQITAFEATRQAKSARRSEIMTKAGDEGVTLDETQSEEYDTLDGEIKKIDEHLKRLGQLDIENKAAAKAVAGNNTDEAARSRAGQQHTVIQLKDQVPPGIGFVRAVMCKAHSFLMLQQGEVKSALEIAKERYPSDERVHLYLKTAVAAGTTTGATWAGPLVDPTNLASEFLEFLRPKTILGKFGTGGIPSLHNIPFNVRITGQTSGGDAYWVGQGKPKPLTKFDFSATTHTWAKVATVAVIAQELARFSSPSAESLVRRALEGAIIERLDRDFVDPDKGAVANVSPASITNNIAPLQTAGSSAADVRVDIAAIMAPFIAANITPTSGVWIMSHTTALRLSLLRNSLGQKEFPELTMMGGTFEGMPVITSQYVLTGSPASELVILVNADDIYLSDDGQVSVDVSREASLEMEDAPTQDGAAGTGASLVSLWQNNLLGLRAERFINWSRRRSAAVAYLEDVTWGLGGGSPS